MSLKAELRTKTGSSQSRKDRAAGKLPVSLYGEGVETTSLLVDAREFEALLKKEGANAVFDLEYDGNVQKVLIRDFTKASLKDEFYDVDLLAVSRDTKLEVLVPLVILNPEKVEPGIATTVFGEIPVETTADNIPDAFEIDATGMEIGDSVTAGELNVPEGVEVMLEADETVMTVTPPTDEPEEVDPDAEMAEPEVIGEEDEDAE